MRTVSVFFLLLTTCILSAPTADAQSLGNEEEKPQTELGYLCKSDRLMRKQMHASIAKYENLQQRLTDDPRPPLSRAAEPDDYGDAQTSKMRPLVPPKPRVTPRMETEGLEGPCAIRFDVSTSGRPFNLAVACFKSELETEAYRAVAKASFVPKRVNGVTEPQYNVVYPIKFCFDYSVYDN